MYPAGVEGVTTRMVALPSGGRIRVAESGPADGRQVLLIHGWCASMYSWRHVLPALAHSGHRALAVDLPGHGLSDEPRSPRAYTTAALVEHLLEVVDALGLDAPVVVGHSMSGRLALEFARTHPTRASALGLIAPSGTRPLPITTLSRPVLALAARVGPMAVPRFAVWAVLRAIWGRFPPPRPEDIDQYWAPSRFPRYERAAYLLIRDFDWSVVEPAVTAAIPVPVTVVLGSRDPLLGVKDVPALARALAPHRVVEIEGAGHVLVDETPERVNEELLRLVRDSSHSASKPMAPPVTGD